MSIPEEEREGQGSNEPTREQCLLDATAKTGSRESLSSLEYVGRRSHWKIDSRISKLLDRKPRPTRRRQKRVLCGLFQCLGRTKA